MQYITTDQRIAVENFNIGLIYQINFTGGHYIISACIGKGADFVVFQRTAPELTYCLNMDSAASVESIDLVGGGGGTLNYNELYNKPKINNVELSGNKSSSELGLAALSDVAPLQAELVELVDSGAKNRLKNNAYTRDVNGVSYTINDDKSVTVSSDGTNTQSLLYLTQADLGLPAGNYVLSGVSGGSSTTYDIRVKVGSNTTINYNGGSSFTTDGSAFEVSIVVRAAQTLNITVYPMICSASAWAISQTYMPYTPTLYELYQLISQ